LKPDLERSNLPPCAEFGSLSHPDGAAATLALALPARARYISAKFPDIP